MSSIVDPPKPGFSDKWKLLRDDASHNGERCNEWVQEASLSERAWAAAKIFFTAGLGFFNSSWRDTAINGYRADVEDGSTRVYIPTHVTNYEIYKNDPTKGIEPEYSGIGFDRRGQGYDRRDQQSILDFYEANPHLFHQTAAGDVYFLDLDQGVSIVIPSGDTTKAHAIGLENSDGQRVNATEGQLHCETLIYFDTFHALMKKGIDASRLESVSINPGASTISGSCTVSENGVRRRKTTYYQVDSQDELFKHIQKRRGYKYSKANKDLDSSKEAANPLKKDAADKPQGEFEFSGPEFVVPGDGNCLLYSFLSRKMVMHAAGEQGREVTAPYQHEVLSNPSVQEMIRERAPQLRQNLIKAMTQRVNDIASQNPKGEITLAPKDKIFLSSLAGSMYTEFEKEKERIQGALEEKRRKLKFAIEGTEYEKSRRAEILHLESSLNGLEGITRRLNVIIPEIRDASTLSRESMNDLMKYSLEVYPNRELHEDFRPYFARKKVDRAYLHDVELLVMAEQLDVSVRVWTKEGENYTSHDEVVNPGKEITIPIISTGKNPGQRNHFNYSLYSNPNDFDEAHFQVPQDEEEMLDEMASPRRFQQMNGEMDPRMAAAFMQMLMGGMMPGMGDPGEMPERMPGMGQDPRSPQSPMPPSSVEEPDEDALLGRRKVEVDLSS